MILFGVIFIAHSSLKLIDILPLEFLLTYKLIVSGFVMILIGKFLLVELEK